MCLDLADGVGMQFGQTQAGGTNKLVNNQVVGPPGKNDVASEVIVSEAVLGEFGGVGMDDPQSEVCIRVAGFTSKAR